MTRRAVLPAALLLLIGSAVGCAAGESGETGTAAAPSSSGPQTTTLVISYDELLNRKNVLREATLSVGDTLQVSLGSNPSTGYRWSPTMLISDAGVVAQAGHETIKPAEDRPGAPGSEVWAIQATGRGQATVATSYGQPWDGGEKNVWTFTAKVTVN